MKCDRRKLEAAGIYTASVTVITVARVAVARTHGESWHRPVANGIDLLRYGLDQLRRMPCT